MIQFLKKYTKALALTLILVTLFAPLAPAIAQQSGDQQQSVASPQESSSDVGSNICIGYRGVIFPYIDVGGCILLGIGYILSFTMNFVSYALTAAAALFDLVLGIQNTAFADQPIVNVGWIIVRDLANIFYMLFLLIIAIATILQYQAYGMRNLLFGLILSAVFVNFSLPIAGLVVDFANVLGNTFYQHMGTKTEGAGYRNISTTIVKGFAPQTAYQPGEKITYSDTAAPPPSTTSAPGVYTTLINYIIAMIMGIVLVLIAAFVIAAGAFLLIIRIVAIWLLFILSPGAFLAFALPSTRQYFNRWFSMLFSQAFFYPAYMFFLYLVFLMIDKKVIAALIGLKGNDTANALQQFTQGSSEFAGSVRLILGMIMLAFLLLQSLKTANQMGAVGASEALNYGKKLKKPVTDYLSKVPRRTFDAANRNTGGFGSEKLLETRAAERLAAIPVLGQSLRGASALARKAQADRAAKAKRDAERAKLEKPSQQLTMGTTLNKQGQRALWEGFNDKQKGAYFKEIGKKPVDDIKDQIKFQEAALKGVDEQVRLGKYNQNQADDQRNSIQQTINDLKKQQADLETGARQQQVQFAQELHTANPDKKYKDDVARISGDAAMALELTQGLKAPTVKPETLKPADLGENATPEERARYDAAMKKYTDAVAETDKYQKKMTEWVSGLRPNELEGLSKDNWKNEYFTQAARQTFAGQDWARVTQSIEKAEAVQQNVFLPELQKLAAKTGQKPATSPEEIQKLISQIKSEKDIKDEVDSKTDIETANRLTDVKLEEMRQEIKRELDNEVQLKKRTNYTKEDEDRRMKGKKDEFRSNVRQEIEIKVKAESITMEKVQKETKLREKDIKWLQTSPGQNVVAYGMRASARSVAQAPAAGGGGDAGGGEKKA